MFQCHVLFTNGLGSYILSERWRLLLCGISVTEQLYPLTIDLQRFRKSDICISIVQDAAQLSLCVSHEQREGRFLS